MGIKLTDPRYLPPRSPTTVCDTYALIKAHQSDDVEMDRDQKDHLSFTTYQNEKMNTILFFKRSKLK
jgi:hypothetical protein